MTTNNPINLLARGRTTSLHNSQLKTTYKKKTSKSFALILMFPMSKVTILFSNLSLM